MVHTLFVKGYGAAFSLIFTALAIPTPQLDVVPNIGDGVPVGGMYSAPRSAKTAKELSGSLYGPPSLLGGLVPPSSGGSSAEVSDYELVNGQQANSDLGLYLNLNNAENPQPLRGNGGQTDPGPRQSILAILATTCYKD